MKKKTSLQVWLEKHEACQSARYWVGDKSYEEAYAELLHDWRNNRSFCPRVWLAWLFNVLEIELVPESDLGCTISCQKCYPNIEFPDTPPPLPDLR